MNYKKFLKGHYLILIACLLLGIIHKNKKWGGPTESWNNICSDGRGYYAWLPAVFIYQDLNFGFHYTVEKDEKFMPNLGCYQNYVNTIHGQPTNKYYPGTSVCMLPFFLGAHLYCHATDTYIANGYTRPYFIAIGVAALCWLYMGLFFFWRTLSALQCSELVKTLTSFIVLFGCNAIYFSVDAPSYSHIYSFGLISAFMWATLRFYQTGAYRFLYSMALLLGWIFIARPVNISILVFIPFLFGNKLLPLLKELLQKPYRALILSICGLAFPLMLFTLYKISTGHFFVYSYGNEGFNFLKPHIYDFLASYDNGLIPYVPALAVPFGILYWSAQGPYRSLSIGLAIMLGLTIYIHASWWCWSYGSSFGPRTLLDFLAAFGVLVALGLSYAPKKIVYMQYALYLLCIGLTMMLHDRRTHGMMAESPITKQEYWKALSAAIGIKPKE